MPPQRAAALLEVPLAGSLNSGGFCERSARLTQSGARYFIAVFEGTMRVDQAAVKPCVSSDSIIERFKIPRVVADQFVAKLLAVSGGPNQPSADSSTTASVPSGDAEQHQTDAAAMPPPPPCPPPLPPPPPPPPPPSTSADTYPRPAQMRWPLHVNAVSMWGAVPEHCTCLRPATCQHSISDAQWMEVERATKARMRRYAIADGVMRSDESWEDYRARRDKEKATQVPKRKRATEHDSESEDDDDDEYA